MGRTPPRASYPAVQKIDAYLRTRKNVSRWAEEHGIYRMQLARLRRGLIRSPSVQLAHALIRATGGVVSYSDFLCNARSSATLSDR